VADAEGREPERRSVDAGRASRVVRDPLDDSRDLDGGDELLAVSRAFVHAHELVVDRGVVPRREHGVERSGGRLRPARPTP
jgi:hypothetical protein